MIKDIIHIKHYWKVIVYFDINYNFFDIIADTLEKYSTPVEDIDDVYFTMINSAKAFTISNINRQVSIVGFNYHDDLYDYINSIIHESEHIKQAILRCYSVYDIGEDAAYTVGYIATCLLKSFNLLNYIK